MRVAVGRWGCDGVDGEAAKHVDEDHRLERAHVAPGFGMDVLAPGTNCGGAVAARMSATITPRITRKRSDAGVIGDGGGQTVVDDGVERADGAEVRGEQAPTTMPMKREE